MKIIAKLIAAGVDPELVGEVAQAIADAQVYKEQSRTLRQERNARYYDNNRLIKTNSDAVKTIKTKSDDQDASSPARESEISNLDSKKTSYQKDPLKGVQKGKVPSNSTALAEDAQPTEKDHDVARQVGMDEAVFRTEWIRFRGHHVARGNRMKNWHQAWVTWAHGWRPNARAGPGPAASNRPTHASVLRKDLNLDQQFASPPSFFDPDPHDARPSAFRRAFDHAQQPDPQAERRALLGAERRAERERARVDDG